MNEFNEYLRSYLHLPPEIVPATLKCLARSETGCSCPTATPGSDKTSEAYRRRPCAQTKREIFELKPLSWNWNFGRRLFF